MNHIIKYGIFENDEYEYYHQVDRLYNGEKSFINNLYFRCDGWDGLIKILKDCKINIMKFLKNILKFKKDLKKKSFSQVLINLRKEIDLTCNDKIEFYLPEAWNRISSNYIMNANTGELSVKSVDVIDHPGKSRDYFGGD